MTEAERLEKVIQWTGLSPNAFAKKIGYERGQTIYNIIKRGRPLNMGIALSITNTFENINLNWLLNEIGDMIVDVGENDKFIRQEIDKIPAKEEKAVLPDPSKSDLSNLIEIIQNQQEAITKLSDAALIHARNIEKLLSGQNEPGTNHDRKAG